MSAPRSVVYSADAPAPGGYYSQAIRSGDFVFCSGQLGLDPATGQLVPGGVTAETDRIFQNLTAVLGAAGAKLEDVVKVTVYLSNFEDFAAFNAAYVRYFTKDPPARATAFVTALPRAANIELEAVARLP